MAQTAPVLDFGDSGRFPEESARWRGPFAKLAANNGLSNGCGGEGAIYPNRRPKHINKAARAAVDKTVDKAIGKPVSRSVSKSVGKPIGKAVDKFVVSEQADDGIRF